MTGKLQSPYHRRQMATAPFCIRSDGAIFVENGSYCSEQGYSRLDKLSATELGAALDNIELMEGNPFQADEAWLAGGAAPAIIPSAALTDRKENLTHTKAAVLARGSEFFDNRVPFVNLPTSHGVARIGFLGGTELWKSFWRFNLRKDIAVERNGLTETLPKGTEVFGFISGIVALESHPGSSYLVKLDDLALHNHEIAMLADDILSKAENQGNESAWEGLLDLARKAKSSPNPLKK